MGRKKIKATQGNQITANEVVDREFFGLCEANNNQY